jgi:hypothetical protein
VSTRRKHLKLWPHMTAIVVVFAALGAGAAALWMRHEQKAEAMSVPRAARVERVDGEVGLSRVLTAGDFEDAGWQELTPNTPLTEGDRLYAREGSRAALAFTGRNFARLEPDSSLDVIALSDRRTQLALRDGSAIFNLGELEPGELFEVATPYGAVDLQEPGLYEVGYNDDGSAFVSVLNGVAQVVGLAGSGQISKGEMLTLLGQTAAQVALSRLSPDYAGGLVDDYYASQYPDAYDGRYSDYNAYLNDPSYYDPYSRDTSYRYVPEYVPGAYDLDRYGDWQNLDGYGYAWSPRVEEGWAPYRQGSWTLDDPYGLTWVSDEPWGYAPYHYGRWVNVNNRWCWLPGDADAQPAYSPALVAFLPSAGAQQVAWVPLAPSDPYAPAYYDANWQPHYFGGQQAAPAQVFNMNAPGGVTVVSVEDFNRPVGSRSVERFDPRAFEGARPVLDPMSVAVLRQASLTRANERRGFTLPPGLAKKLESRQVYTSAQPQGPAFREEVARRLRVEPVPDGRKREKLEFKDERQAAVAPQATAPARGRSDERDAARQLRQQQREQERAARASEAGPRQQPPPAQPEAERVAGRGAERPMGERPVQARQAQREAERQQRTLEQQQRAANAQQQRAEFMRQAEARRQAGQQQAAQRAQQQAAQRAQQQQQQEAARRAQPRGRPERQQAQPAPSAGGPPERGRPSGPPHGGGEGGGGGGGGGGPKGGHGNPGKGKGRP